MTLIQKLITRLKKVFFGIEGGMEKADVELRLMSAEEYFGETTKTQEEPIVYLEKDRNDPLDFQNKCNDELFWNGQGG